MIKKKLIIYILKTFNFKPKKQHQKLKTMRNVKLEFRREATLQSRSEDLIATAEVRAENEQSAEIFLDNYLEEEYPDYGRGNCHFEENGIYYFNVIKN